MNSTQEQIIIIDDTPANLHVLSTLLKENGYLVRSFPNGKLALAFIEKFSPSLILLDIKMPNMDGYEVCQHLKANELTCDIPVIFISALDEVMDKLKAFTLGGVDYITKPFQAEEVLARISTHLELSRLQKLLKQENYMQAQQLAKQNKQLQQINQELEKANQELNQKYDELKQAQLTIIQSEKMATLGNLVAGVAHEINNPVGFISGNLDYATKYIQYLIDLLELYQQGIDWNSQTTQEKIEEIELDYLLTDLPGLIDSMKEGTKRIAEISKSMRTFSRDDTIAKVAFKIHDGIDSTLLILRHRLKANEKRSEIEVVKNYGNLLPVYCYPGQLNQVFMNLIANAIDALEESNFGKTFEEIKAAQNQITITTEIDSENQQAIIRIRDNGMGMSQEVKNKIFCHLFTTKKVGKGTGLGLSISRQIVEEKHGGKITFTSELGKGSEFTISLPNN
ncbi:MAG: hybrid sensor histidine kinase/response regulator [Okeania sp. SIO3I5]|uniref:hybrid sensor histidine kinase/response regulator n=1 Tax=Okeania sp. SIO3I5 TaxID=2607805 RepID=UPI0013BB4A61|nr:response regulator [Okeania sp. SIO3I5]NEQ35447.1 hybrid sensor histidine kinase/response regulator [Okeania sp. SIO3I5]